jgi:hypothetical protein
MKYKNVSAFPESYIGADSPHEGVGNGMFLRDYFAAKALHGLMGRDWSHMKNDDNEILKAWVTSSYAIADMMLAERDK